MKSLFEQMGGTYREENGYLIPNLSLPDEEQVEIGVWGQRHLRYIKQHHKVLLHKSADKRQVERLSCRP